MLERLSALAARQDGLLTRFQLLSAGVPSSTIGTWAARQQLIVVHRGVYALPASELTIRATARAAVLALGDVPAVASYQLAANVHGLGVRALGTPAHVTIPTALHRPSRRALVIHQADLRNGEVKEVEGLRVTIVPRTLGDLLCGDDRLSAVWACEAALRRQLITDADLKEVVRRCAGRRHATRSRHWRALVDVRSESPLETAIRLLLLDAGLPSPVPQHPVRSSDGRLLARLDLAWPDRRIGLEADGKEPHGQPRPIYTDRWRANALVGWQLIRFTWHDVLRRPAYIAATVRAHLCAAT